MWCLGFIFKPFIPSQYITNFLFILYKGFGGGGGGGGMVVFTYNPALYNDYGMTVEVYNGVEGMGDFTNGGTFPDHEGEPGSDGQKYMNGVQV